tara:strand:- start:2897 stop:3286 length:390 start_codon:yes stop_codon:yes gene_type:complete
MAIKVGGVTVVDDSRGLSNIASGAVVGIQSAGTTIGAGATTLNFVGSGNSISYDSSTNTIDISITGGGGGTGTADTTGITTSLAFSNPQNISTDAFFNTPGLNYGMFGPVTIDDGVTVTVGAGNSFTII